MAQDKPLEVLKEAASRKREVIDKCQELLDQANENERTELRSRIEREANRLFRLETCIDILKGEIEPSDETLRVVKAVEKSGNEDHHGKDEMKKEDKEAILGMSVEDTIKIWEEQGKPEIPLVQGEKCTDLKNFLSGIHPAPRKLERVANWLGGMNG